MELDANSKLSEIRTKGRERKREGERERERERESEAERNMEWCVSLPKVELHAHLNGSIRDSTLL